MCNLELFKIDLRKLDGRGEVFHYSLGDSFFEALEGTEVRGGDVKATAEVRPVTHGCFELLFHVEGTVEVVCDLCLDNMSLPICADGRLIARFGNPQAVYMEDGAADDDVIVVDEEDGTVDVSWLLYEIVALDIPIRHVHEDGECNQEMVKVLGEHMVAESEMQPDNRPADPRWSELEKLKTIIKD